MVMIYNTNVEPISLGGSVPTILLIDGEIYHPDDEWD